MTATPNLALPWIDAGQSQKHVTHNAALSVLDALTQLGVAARGVLSAPSAPADGWRCLVGAGASGVFAGHDLAVAAFQDGAWGFFPPRAGWVAFVAAESAMLVYDGAQWRGIGAMLGPLDRVPRLGVGADSDPLNALLVSANAALFTAKAASNGGSGDFRLGLNKSAGARTGSLLHQTNYSGRAETGLVGDDNYRVKVSADGTTWRDALVVDAATGVVATPQGLAAIGATDWNSATQCGFYAATNAPNAPGAGAFAGTVSAGGGVVRQRLFAGAGGVAYRRDFTSGAWSAWAPCLETQTDLDARYLARVPLNASKNKLINGSFRINQRGYASGAALAAGAFGHDRWVNAASGAGSYSFTQAGPAPNSATSPIDTTITLPAGASFQQFIEPRDNEGGLFTLSWSGSATAQVYYFDGSTYQSAMSGSGPSITGAIPVGVTCLVRFNGPGALSAAQFEAGSVATPFERRPFAVEFALCQRYYRVSGQLWGANSGPLNTATFATDFGQPMRTTPTAFLVNGSINSGSLLEPQIAQRVVSAVNSFGGGPLGGRIEVTVGSSMSGAYRPAALEPGALAFNAEF